MSFLRDLRIAAYSLTRTQGLAVVVILTLTLGIGANAAIFTLVRGVLLKPLVVAAVASMLPAARAARTDAIQALGSE